MYGKILCVCVSVCLCVCVSVSVSVSVCVCMAKDWLRGCSCAGVGGVGRVHTHISM